MTDLEYRLIKETVKQEILREMILGEPPKTESALLEVKRRQRDIFECYFSELRKLDAARYWRIKEAIIKLTNLCRFRSCTPYAWDSSLKTETEAESAIATYAAICKMIAEFVGKLN